MFTEMALYCITMLLLAVTSGKQITIYYQFCKLKIFQYYLFNPN